MELSTFSAFLIEQRRARTNIEPLDVSSETTL